MSSTCEMEELSIVAAPPRIRRSDASVRIKLATVSYTHLTLPTICSV